MEGRVMKLKLALQKNPTKKSHPPKIYKCKEKVDGKECSYIGARKLHYKQHLKTIHHKNKDLKCDRYGNGDNRYDLYPKLHSKLQGDPSVRHLESYLSLKLKQKSILKRKFCFDVNEK